MRSKNIGSNKVKGTAITVPDRRMLEGLRQCLANMGYCLVREEESSDENSPWLVHCQGGSGWPVALTATQQDKLRRDFRDISFSTLEQPVL